MFLLEVAWQKFSKSANASQHYLKEIWHGFLRHGVLLELQLLRPVTASVAAAGPVVVVVVVAAAAAVVFS